MAKAKFDIKTEATRPLYAGVGVTDLAVEAVREYVAEVQNKLAEARKDVSTRVADAQKTVNGLDFQPQVLREQAIIAVGTRVDALSKDAKARREAVEARVAELHAEARTLVDENLTTFSAAYADLAKRGQTLVERIRNQQSTQATVTAAQTTATKAKTTRTQATTATKPTAKTTAKKVAATAKKATDTAKKTSTAPRSSAKATATAAKKTATNAAQATTDAAVKVGD